MSRMVFGTSTVYSEFRLRYLKTTGFDVVVLWTIVDTSEVLEYEVSPDTWRAAKAIEDISNTSDLSMAGLFDGVNDVKESSLLGHKNNEPEVTGLSEADMIQYNNYFLQRFKDRVNYQPVKLLTDSSELYHIECNDCRDVIWKRPELEPGISFGEHHAKDHLHCGNFKSPKLLRNPQPMEGFRGAGIRAVFSQVRSISHCCPPNWSLTAV
jgi:hypothetical protein